MTSRRGQKANHWLPEQPQALTTGSHIAVIGAGIAGATLAHQLAQAGMQVSVFESNPQPAMAASGNIAGNCLPVVDRGITPYAQWYWQAWQAAYHWWRALENPFDYGDLTAAFKWSQQAKKQHTWQQWAEALAQPQIARWQTGPQETHQQQGLRFFQGGYLQPKRVVNALLTHEHIRLNTDSQVTKLTQTPRGSWQLEINQQTTTSFDAVIMATGAQTKTLLPDWAPYLLANKGQVSHLAIEDWQTPPSMVLSYDGYVTPAVNGITCVGATFENDTPLGIDTAGHQHNLDLLQKHLPYALKPHAQVIGGHSAYRIMTADHLPLVGQAVQVSDYQARMRPCILHPDTCLDAKDLLIPNLWFSLGHGARGLTSSFLAASELSAQITGSVSPLSEQLRHAVHPCRIIFRQMVKNALK